MNPFLSPFPLGSSYSGFSILRAIAIAIATHRTLLYRFELLLFGAAENPLTRSFPHDRGAHTSISRPVVYTSDTQTQQSPLLSSPTVTPPITAGLPLPPCNLPAFCCHCLCPSTPALLLLLLLFRIVVVRCHSESVDRGAHTPVSPQPAGEGVDRVRRGPRGVPGGGRHGPVLPQEQHGRHPQGPPQGLRGAPPPHLFWEWDSGRTHTPTTTQPRRA